MPTNSEMLSGGITGADAARKKINQVSNRNMMWRLAKDFLLLIQSCALIVQYVSVSVSAFLNHGLYIFEKEACF
jgi:hypothetical protein